MYKCTECGETVDEMFDLIDITIHKCWKNMSIPDLIELDKVLVAFREVVKAGIIGRVAEDDSLMGIARKALEDDPDLLKILEDARRMVLEDQAASDDDEFEFPDNLPQIG